MYKRQAQASEKVTGWQAKQAEAKAATEAASAKLKEVYDMVSMKK